jgi:hypothetical protein
MAWYGKGSYLDAQYVGLARAMGLDDDAVGREQRKLLREGLGGSRHKPANSLGRGQRKLAFGVCAVYSDGTGVQRVGGYWAGVYSVACIVFHWASQTLLKNSSKTQPYGTCVCYKVCVPVQGASNCTYGVLCVCVCV